MARRHWNVETLASTKPGLSGAFRIGIPNDIPDTQAMELETALRELYAASGGATPDVATETAKGVVELATEPEVQSGAGGVLVATVARLKAELDRRAAIKSEVGAIDNGPIIFNAVTVGTSVPMLSGDLRGLGGIPADAKGVFVTLDVSTQSSQSTIGVSSADVTPGTTLRLRCPTTNPANTSGPVRLATGVNEGKIAILLYNENTTNFSMWVNGWWR